MSGVIIDCFKTIPDDDFNAMLEKDKNEEFDLPHNYCEECRVPMNIMIGEMRCGVCGRLEEFQADPVKDHGETISANIRITTGPHRGRFYNLVSDYSRTQMKSITNQLSMLNSLKNNIIPKDILAKTAARYNSIQKLTVDDQNEKKKFVKRGNIKDEVLAAILYYECIAAGTARKKRDIAAMMNLPTGGFSKGEHILRELRAKGQIDLDMDNEPISSFVDRYMEALGFEDQIYKDFVEAIVVKSEDLKIGMNSQISSKIVGAIYLLVQIKKLPVTTQALEKATDNTKKNTFMKFYNVVKAHPDAFQKIIEEFVNDGQILP